MSSVATNAGQFNVFGGQLALDGGVNNSGLLIVRGGSVSVSGPVTGAGFSLIYGGTLELKLAVNQNVEFSNGQARGKLILGQAQSYGGELIDFSYNSKNIVSAGKSSLDLRDIGFVGASEATFKGNKTSGVLTVTDGTHTAKITLEGDYLSATFLASSDGEGGTDVVVAAVTLGIFPPSVTGAATLVSMQHFVSALASLAGPASGRHVSSEHHESGRLLLAAPRTAAV